MLCPKLRVATLALLLCLGCSTNSYEVVLEPTEDGIQRSLKIDSPTEEDADGTSRDRISDAEFAMIAKAYGEEQKREADGEYEFSGSFQSQLPDGIGGSGSYFKWGTPAGAVSIYIERFRGNDDLLAIVQERQAYVNVFTDHLKRWLQSELKGAQGLEKLTEFIDVQLRRDLTNLSLYVVAAMLGTPDDEPSEVEAIEYLGRIGQYFFERGYISVDDFPELIRASTESENGHSQRLLLFIQRIVASRMGIGKGDEVPRELNFIAHELSLRLSAEKYIRTTEEFRLALAHAAEKGETKPDAIQVLMESFSAAFLPTSFQGFDSLNVKLKTSVAPDATNGIYDAQKGFVKWRREMEPRLSTRSEFPAFAFAIWSEPNEAFQKKHFGKTVLRGRDLSQFCIWYRGLDKDEAAQWDTLVEESTSPEVLVEKLLGFRFSHEPPAVDDADDKDLAAPIRKILLSNLLAEEDP